MSSDQGEIFAGISTFTRYKPQHPASMEDLPDDLLINIFIRLLAKQLAQMRTLSKSWNTLLSNPSFVKSHLHHSIHNNNNQQILLVFPGSQQPFTQYSCKSPHLEPTNFVKHIPPNLPMEVIGSVNGLICISDKSYSNIHIWNPSLSAVSTIPPPNYLNSTFFHNIRFSFDPKTEDYKLVKLTGVLTGLDFTQSVKKWLQVEVYSVRKGYWEFITQPLPSHITRAFHVEYLCLDGHNGRLHWQDAITLKTSSTIVAFDLVLETFRKIPLPDSIPDSNHEFHHLGVLAGKLCVISLVNNRLDACAVWVMEEYGMRESWVKRHVIPGFSGNWRYSYGFTSRNDVLFGDKDGRVFLYDPIAKKG